MRSLIFILLFLPFFIKGQEYIIDPAFNDLEDRYKAEVNYLFYEDLDNTIMVVGDPYSTWPNLVSAMDKISIDGIPYPDWYPEDFANFDELQRISRVSDGYRIGTSSSMPHYDFDCNAIEGTQIEYGDWQTSGNIGEPYIAVGDTIYIPGLFYREVNGDVEYKQVLKFHPDGTLDESFIPSECKLSTSPFPPHGNSFIKYNEESLILATSMDSINGHATNHFARVYMDGSVDTSFVSEITLEGGTGLLHVDDQGRVLVTRAPRSTFFQSDSTEVFRLMPDGSLDPSWTPIDLGYKPNLSIGRVRHKAIIPLEDGGYILGGWFNYVNGIRRTSIVKVDSTGAVDETLFNNEPFWVDYENFPFNWYLNDTIPEINVLMPMEEGILVGGRFTHYGETVRRSLVKLILDETIGFDDAKDLPKPSIYPNPTSGDFTIRSNTQSTISELRVYDLSGRSLPFTVNRYGLREWRVSLSAPSGMYILKLIDKNGNMSSAKLQVE